MPFHVIICHMCILFSEMSLFKSLAHFLVGLLACLFVYCRVLRVYIPDTSRLLDTWFANILPQSVVCFFCLLIVFHRAKVLNFDKIQFINFSLYGSYFWCLRALCPVLDPDNFLLCYFLYVL